MIVNSIQEVFEKESSDKLAAMNVHQHECICIEKASEYMVGQSKEQKGRQRHHTYLITRNVG
jgi:hypothetical protein